jgi:putative membrane-bound dehydrogenase-like protein
MRTAAILASLLAATACAGADPKPTDRPVPTKDAARAMTVPEGFTVTLFAGEPDVVQPLAFGFDDRGRMWVVECLSYPNWRRDGKGGDRVVILEDTDGDGTFDKKTVFLDNGSNLSGIELGFGGVWLCSSPNLIFIPLKDGEDKPAGPPQVVLDGWNMIDTKHNIFNSLTWGPDGWLYGCNGIQAKAWVGAPGTPKDKRTYLDCGVWRYHPTRKAFEAVAHGTTNPFGLDFDDFGELFITNCVIDHLFHFVPGGHYERMYGQDANPFVYGLMKSCVDYRHWASGDWTQSRSTGTGGKPEHSDAGGGHAHSGCAIYLADNFPAEYRNTLFTANIHGNRLNNDGLARTPSGYKGVRRPDFLFANDSWFRGICVKTGPEGGLYVSDWSDTGECHNYDKVDTSNGRIYRVVYKGTKPWTGDVSKATDAELVKLQLSPNDWVVRQARRVLQERAAAGKLARGTGDALRSMLNGEKTVPHQLRAAWALHVIGELQDGDISFMFKSADPAMRAFGARLALDAPETSKLVRNLVADLGADESAQVRRALAGQVHRLNGSDQIALIDNLLKQPADRDTTWMLWYALEPTVSTEDIERLTAKPHPLLLELTVRKLLSDAAARPNVLHECVAVLTKVTAGATRATILRGIRDSLLGAKVTDLPAGWESLHAALAASKTAEVRDLGDEVALIFGDPKVVASLLRRVTDTSAPPAARESAIRLLAPRKLPDFAKALQGLLDDPALRGTAIRTLAAFPDANTPSAILKAYKKFTPAEKADAVQTLSARVAFAKELLDAIDNGTIPRADVPVTAARQMLALNDKPTAERLEKVWGKITPVAKERAALMKKWKDVLTDEALAKADVGKGRAVFAKTCASCHKMFGEGQAVGPELTGSQRANLDYVLENVLDPSAVVPREYQLINFTLADERVVGGIVVRETKDAVTVRTVNDTLTISTSEILTRKQTPVSLMPEGLLDALKPDEVRDLVAYLRAKEQVPLPK